jgi:hypothetical protein
MLWESRGHFVALYCRLEQNGGGKKMIAILFLACFKYHFSFKSFYHFNVGKGKLY